MNKRPSLRKWIKYFQRRGLSEDVVALYLPYIKKIQSNNAPVVFEFEHLSKLIGINRVELAKMVNSPENFHREFFIRKRKGGKREIVAPYPSLLHCQKWIYKNILMHQSVHESVHGYVPGRSIISNASIHLSKNALLKMDFKDFFPSIPINWVIQFFSSLGYSGNVSYYLASLCCYEGKLSQGSATSPYLTNILLNNLDERLHKLSNCYSLSYTRYADDLTFSGDYIPHKFVGIVDNICSDYGLQINNEKTMLHTKPGKRIITGLSVAGNELKIPRERKRELRKEVFFIKKYGYLSHLNKKKIKHPNYLDSLLGKLGFWLVVEPEAQFPALAIEYLDGIKRTLES